MDSSFARRYVIVAERELAWWQRLREWLFDGAYIRPEDSPLLTPIFEPGIGRGR